MQSSGDLLPPFMQHIASKSKPVRVRAPLMSGAEELKELSRVAESENESKQTSRETDNSLKLQFSMQRTRPLNRRAEKLYAYLCKKYHKKKGFQYKRRARVAAKRLRIKGRFVTRD